MSVPSAYYPSLRVGVTRDSPATPLPLLPAIVRRRDRAHGDNLQTGEFRVNRIPPDRLAVLFFLKFRKLVVRYEKRMFARAIVALRSIGPPRG